MGDKEFHQLLGIIIDSDGQGATRAIVEAADDRAKEMVLRNLARDNGMDPNSLATRDITDILGIIRQIHELKGRILPMSVRR